MLKRDWVLLFFLLGFAVPLHAATRVDLQIESIQIQPPEPTTVKTVTVVASIRNNGSQAVENGTLSVTLKKDGKKIKTIEDVPVLSSLPRSGAGLSVPLSLGKLQPGDYETVVTVDPGNRIPETNENNNTAFKAFRVRDAAASY